MILRHAAAYWQRTIATYIERTYSTHSDTAPHRRGNPSRLTSSMAACFAARICWKYPCCDYDHVRWACTRARLRCAGATFHTEHGPEDIWAVIRPVGTHDTLSTSECPQLNQRDGRPPCLPRPSRPTERAKRTVAVALPLMLLRRRHDDRRWRKECPKYSLHIPLAF